MAAEFSDAELLAYLDEMLPISHATRLEDEVRKSAQLRQRMSQLAKKRDQGGHTVGEVWRRNRVSCLTRSQLGSYILGTLDAGTADYVEFHLHTIGCRICAANLDDLQQSQQQAGEPPRRRRFFESSAGLLKSRGD